MTKENYLLEKYHFYQIACHNKYPYETSAPRHYTHLIKKINNIHIKDSFLSFENKANASHDILNSSNNTEKEKIDYLFNCVNELNNNMDCLLTAGHTKYIQIEMHDKKFSIATKKLTLPSGNKIFAGYFNTSLVVSDGNNYHVQHESHNPLSFTASFTLLLSHLVQSGGWRNVYNWPDWAGSTAKWFSGLRDPLVFPQSEGQPIASSVLHRNTILHTAEAEISARLRSGKDHESDENLNQAVVSPTASALSETLLPQTEYTSGEADAYRRLMFSINGLEFQLSLANNEAQTLLLNMFQDFVRANNSPLSDSLSNLLEFDKYLGKKMAKIFHGGLYLKDKITSLNIIISKVHFEDIIASLEELTEENLLNLERLKRHGADNFMVEDFISDIVKQLKEASRRINIDIIKDVISIIKNKTFDMTKLEITKKIKEKTLGRKFHYKKILHTLNLCQQAYDEYRLQLYLDENSPIARTNYINTQQIYYALIHNDKRHLRNSLTKSKFYSIFEYTRMNGISLYSLNFIMPGEITDMGDVFTADEQVFHKEKMDSTFFQELMDYIHQRPSVNHYFERLLDMTELFRTDSSGNSSLSSWQQKNLAPLEQTYDSLSEMIENNHDEQGKFTNHPVWHNEFKSILDKDKTLFILLSYLINMQEIFTHHANDYIEHNIDLTAYNDEQRIVAAKIEAIRTSVNTVLEEKNDSDLLRKYNDIEKSGNLYIFTKAARARLAF